MCGRRRGEEGEGGASKVEGRERDFQVLFGERGESDGILILISLRPVDLPKGQRPPQKEKRKSQCFPSGYNKGIRRPDWIGARCFFACIAKTPSPATGGRVWVAGARIATPAPGLLKVPERLEFAMCVRSPAF